MVLLVAYLKTVTHVLYNIEHVGKIVYVINPYVICAKLVILPVEDWIAN